MPFLNTAAGRHCKQIKPLEVQMGVKYTDHPTARNKLY